MIREASLRYVLLPSKLAPGHTATGLHNQAFTWWTDFWDDVYQSVGAPDRTNADMFRRHDVFSIVLAGDRIAAMLTCTHLNFDLAADRNHGFFRNQFTPRAQKAVDSLSVRDVMIMECFGVAKEWQRRSNNVSMGLVLLSLSQNFFLETSAEVWFGVARADVGAAKICYSIGAIPLDKGVVVHEAPSDMIAVPRGKASIGGTPEEVALVKQLWDNREVYCEIPVHNRVKRVA